MPRVNLGKTPDQLRFEAKERHKDKVIKIIRAQMVERDISKRQLADMTMIDYQKICRMCQGKTAIDIWSMTRIANALSFTDEQRSSVISGKC